MLRPLPVALVLVALLVAGCTGGPPQAAETPPGNDNGGASGNATAGNGTANVTATVRSGAPARTVDLSVSTSGQYPIDPGFEPATLSVASGTIVNLTFSNVEMLPLFGHNWMLEGYEDSAGTETIDSGQSTSVVFAAPAPGTYAYYCAIGDHRDRGMEGTLTVT
ncbi:MAG TPA: cupredoxin domain-containing protein [Candidatus Thermoplasmatota archaeon]|jgi:plastocyanin|nr:cupredoxin domain-containing protein [Candidatus Thermoplasmatota archaeon]